MPLFPIKNSLLKASKVDLLAWALECRLNAKYNHANGFEWASEENVFAAEFYEFLAERAE